MNINLRQVSAACMLGHPNPNRDMTLVEHLTLWSPGRAFRRKWYERSREANLFWRVL